jgi:hypothetical protein
VATISVGDETYEFDPDKFLSVELMAVERQTGFSAQEFMDRLNKVSMTAVTALFWLMRKRHKDPQSRFDDISFMSEELTLDFRTPEEKAREEEVAAAAEAMRNPPPEPESVPAPTPIGADPSPTPGTTTSSDSLPDSDFDLGSVTG